MDPLSIDAFTPAIAMLDALHKRQVSAVELLDLHLRRIERYNPPLNAIVTFDVEYARHTANAADKARARGEHGALLGLPVTIKDTIDVKGYPARLASSGIRTGDQSEMPRWWRVCGLLVR